VEIYKLWRFELLPILENFGEVIINVSIDLAKFYVRETLPLIHKYCKPNLVKLNLSFTDTEFDSSHGRFDRNQMKILYRIMHRIEHLTIANFKTPVIYFEKFHLLNTPELYKLVAPVDRVESFNRLKILELHNSEVEEFFKHNFPLLEKLVLDECSFPNELSLPKFIGAHPNIKIVLIT
jgi:hypothetical protein